MSDNRKEHWETVYTTRQPGEVSWTQDVPRTSLELIQSLRMPRSARIIDIGGGDSKLVDFLLEEGYEHITVLDISAAALECAKARLGDKAARVTWIVSDITEFAPDGSYDVWHDRAAFHFLTTAGQIQKYIRTAGAAVKGYMILGTFSENGPARCSGLEIKRYSEPQLEEALAADFTKIRCMTEDHVTPFHTVQNFLFCCFRKKNAQAPEDPARR